MYVRLLYLLIYARLPASLMIKQAETMATARSDMRIDDEDKANAEKAAALLGKKPDRACDSVDSPGRRSCYSRT